MRITPEQVQSIADGLPLGRDPAAVRRRIEAMEALLERLFLIPGQNHCGGGQTLDAFDSLTAIELLVALESNFGVSIAPTELEREEMNTLNKIVARTRERM